MRIASHKEKLDSMKKARLLFLARSVGIMDLRLMTPRHGRTHIIIAKMHHNGFKRLGITSGPGLLISKKKKANKAAHPTADNVLL